MSNLSAPFIKRPIATSLFMIAILLVGILAFNLLPISALPEVEYPTIQVATPYPGASPELVATTVTAPLERQFGQMPGLLQMTSSSSFGSSIITLQFNLDMNLDVAVQQVQAAIISSQNLLPANLPTPPIYSKVNPADAPVITLALNSKSLNLTEVQNFAETRFVPKISEITGVGIVRLSGGQRPAIRVQVNPTLLASYALNLEDIRATINNANSNGAKGSIDGEILTYTINSNDQLLTKSDFEKLIITYFDQGAIYLKDIADISEGPENTQLAAWLNNEPSIILDIQKQPNTNVIEIVDKIKNILPKLKASIPKEINILIVNDRTITIRKSINHAKFDLILSIILVVLIIYLFLNNFSATFIPSLAVPLSLIGTFSVMYYLNYSFNNLTIMALTIATGFVVDDAIVMIENISRYLEKGLTPLDAALKGAAQIGFTILTLTISIISVLIPLFFMEDIIGRLFREFAATLAISIFISAIVSLTLTPMLCRKLLKSDKNKEIKINFFQKILNIIIEKYSITLKFVLSQKNKTILFSFIVLLITGILFVAIPKGFFPIQDTGVIIAITEAPQSVSFSEMNKRQKKIAEKILEDPAVENITSITGIDGINTTLNSGRILITLKPFEVRKISSEKLIKKFQKKLDNIKNIKTYMQPVQDLTVENKINRTQFQYSITSPSSKEVDNWSKQIIEKLIESPLFNDVTSDIQNSGLRAEIVIDHQLIGTLGITQTMIDNAIYNSFGQRPISTIFTNINQYNVILEANPKLKITLQNLLDHIYIQNNGNIIPFSAFAKVVESTTPLVINRKGQFPVATISFNLAPGASLGSAVTAIEDTKNKLQIPPSLHTSFEGVTQIFQNSITNSLLLILASITVVYIILGILYESYIHPLTILSTLPSAGLGALLALFITGHEFNIISLIGLILLIGIVKKNAIMMIDFALDLQRNQKLMPEEAIYQACLLRFRPILMTTMAALLAAIPLAFGNGIGSELRKPLGISIIGGLILSQILTLYTTPVVYLFFDKISKIFLSLAPKNREKENPQTVLDIKK